MSYRNRERLVTCTSPPIVHRHMYRDGVFCNYAHDTKDMLNNTTDGCYNGYLSRETMVDEVGVGGRRVPHYCLHIKTDAARGDELTAGWRSGKDANNHTYFDQFYNTFSLCPVSVSLSIPDADWATSLSGLANSVDHIIENKSLLLVSLYEMRKTWEMIKNPLSLLNPSAYLKRGKATAAQLAKFGSGIWMGINYGWRPLLYDIEGYANAFGTYNGARTKVLPKLELSKYRNNAMLTVSTPDPTMSDSAWNALVASVQAGYISTAPSSGFPYQRTRLIYKTPTVSATVTCSVKDSLLAADSQIRQAQALLGLTAKQIVATLWEVVPFSWMVDWFVNMKGLGTLYTIANAQRTLNQVAVRNECYAIKARVPFSAQCLTQRRVDMWPFGSTKDKACGNLVCSGSDGQYLYYYRVAGLPSVSTSVFNNRRLSISQLITTGSVITQML